MGQLSNILCDLKQTFSNEKGSAFPLKKFIRISISRQILNK